MVVVYGRRAEHWDEMERRFIQRAHLFRGIAARRASTKRLAELDRRRKLPGEGHPLWRHHDPAYGARFGGGDWSSSLVPSPKGNRVRNEAAAKCMDQWSSALHGSIQPQKRHHRRWAHKAQVRACPSPTSGASQRLPWLPEAPRRRWANQHRRPDASAPRKLVLEPNHCPWPC
jgi:hypothetical protein